MSGRTADLFRAGLGLSPLVARLLEARGWRELAAATEFLHPRLEHTHSPWLMLGMKTAVERTRAAIDRGEPIRILGDYDADGTLATVILRQALASLGAQVSYRLPERLRDGYGLQAAAMDQAVAEGVKLAITVDTGIREHAALERARELGLDVIVTDHHLPAESLPPAFAVLNPHQPGCPYPDKGLCGSGVAFKLAHALLEQGGLLEGAWPPRLRSYLKLVAMATIADAVPLVGENRVLARFGLEGLAQPVNPGLQALLALALPQRPLAIRSADVAYRIAPRLNAAGRMGAADRVVELFFAPAPQAAELAQSLESLNQQRQALCAAILAEVEARTDAAAGPVVVHAGEGWHRGVLGIVASRVVERSGKAALVIAIEPDAAGDLQAHGSGRAPAGIPLHALLDGCRELFTRFGGHAQAVGFSLPAEQLPPLRAYLQSADLASLPAGAAQAEYFDCELAELTPAVCQELRRLEPFGEANPEPLFRIRRARLAQPPAILKERHLKLTLEQDGIRHIALYWNAPELPALAALAPGSRMDLSFRIEHTSHPQYGERTQLIVREIFVTAAAAADS
ncbi:MAG TPA: single-stranded-DNA-specific exonuclease RecJ [Terriglobales bacterium]|nr:single-stranded-DNA-specific exonuclease RecJ [Terriglobales bacterium]